MIRVSSSAGGEWREGRVERVENEWREDGRRWREGNTLVEENWWMEGNKLEEEENGWR